MGLPPQEVPRADPGGAPVPTHLPPKATGLWRGESDLETPCPAPPASSLSPSRIPQSRHPQLDSSGPPWPQPVLRTWAPPPPLDSPAGPRASPSHCLGPGGVGAGHAGGAHTPSSGPRSPGCRCWQSFPRPQAPGGLDKDQQLSQWPACLGSPHLRPGSCPSGWPRGSGIP